MQDWGTGAQRMRRFSQATAGRALVAALAGVLGACSGFTGSPTGSAIGSPTPVSSRPPSLTSAPRTDPPPLGRLDEPLQRPDILITSGATLSPGLVRRVRAIPEVAAVERLSVGALSVEGRTLSVAAVDPTGFRRFTPHATAYADDVWSRVAGGEVAVDPSTPRKVVGEGDLLSLGESHDAEKVHVGAYARLAAPNPLLPRPPFQAVVNREHGGALGLPHANALLVSTGGFTPSGIRDQLERVLGDRATFQILALEFDAALQTAVLTGGSVAAAVGSFRYTNGPRGTIRPSRDWVAAYIRTEAVPILGDVTCNKAVLPQLRAALTEIVRRGLATRVHPGEYAGCYYPRYIGRDAANGLSLHSWGIALDLNVPGNRRGTAGEMDRSVVEVFKRWGFAWGGDWSYTDPMHFEMSRVVDVGRPFLSEGH